MAIAAPTQLATISSNTTGQTTWSTGSIVFPTNGAAVLGLMELCLSGYTATLGLTVADNLGNTWTVVTGATAESTVGVARCSTAIAYFLYPSGGANTTATVTATFNSLNERFGWCGYTTGHDTTTPVDQSGSANTGTGVATITAAVSSADTAAGDLSLVAMGLTAGSNLTVTWPSSSGASYTSLANNADTVRHRNGAFEYQVLGAAGTESTAISYSGNASSVASIVTFKAASGGTNVSITHVVGTTTLGGTAPTLTEAFSPSVGLLTLPAAAPAPGETLTHTVGTVTLGASAVTLTEAMQPTAGLVTLGASNATITGASASATEFISGKLFTLLRR